METIKFQKDMLARLLRGDRVFYQKLEDGREILSDGARAFIFYGDLCIKPEQCIQTEILGCACEENEKDEFLSATGRIIVVGEKRLVEYEKKDGTRIYLWEKLIAGLKGCNFKGRDAKERVIVVNDVNIPIAVIMPFDLRKKDER